MGLLDWLHHSGNDYGIECTTLAGEKVKSRGEKYIADYFFQKGIKYEYEKTAKTHAWIFAQKISKPDFYLPEYDVYVEYWGLVDADKKRVKSEYVRSMKWKMAMYHKNKIKFISLYPSNLENLDWVFRKKLEEVTGRCVSPSPSPNQPTRAMAARNFCSNCGPKIAQNANFCQRCGQNMK